MDSTIAQILIERAEATSAEELAKARATICRVQDLQLAILAAAPANPTTPELENAELNDDHDTNEEFFQ